MQALLREISDLFPDTLFVVGGDETGTSPPCTLANTRSFETKMINFVQHGLGKTAVVWEEALFDSGAANGSRGVVIDTWQQNSWEDAAAAGHMAVSSNEPRLYLDYPEHTAAAMWYDLTNGSGSGPSPTAKSLLGGEVSMVSPTPYIDIYRRLSSRTNTYLVNATCNDSVWIAVERQIRATWSSELSLSVPAT